MRCYGSSVRSSPSRTTSGWSADLHHSMGLRRCPPPADGGTVDLLSTLWRGFWLPQPHSGVVEGRHAIQRFGEIGGIRVGQGDKATALPTRWSLPCADDR